MKEEEGTTGVGHGDSGTRSKGMVPSRRCSRAETFKGFTERNRLPRREINRYVNDEGE